NKKILIWLSFILFLPQNCLDIGDHYTISNRGPERRIGDTNTMAKIITAGRTDTKDLFEIGDPFQWERLNHTPFLVFVEEAETIRVEIVNSKKKLLAYPNETKVM